MTEPVSPSATKGPRHRRSVAGGALLGLAMGAANVLGYAFLLVLSRSLGPADFGAFSALNNYGMMLTIPAGAFQLALARRVASGERAGGTASALVVGATLASLTILCAPVLAHALRTGSILAIVLLAGMLVTMSVSGVHLGVLLGQRRYVALSLLYLVIAVGRFGAAVAAAHLGLGVTGVIGAILASSVVSVLCGVALTRSAALKPFHVDRSLLREMWRSMSTLAALLALTSVDVVLARIVLSDYESGLYALAAVFGKAVFWGTQFIALYVVPAVQSDTRRTTLLRAVAITAALGGLATVFAFLIPEILVDITGGQAYAGASTLIVAYTVLGTLWGCSQVLLFGEIAQRRRLLGRIAWIAVGVESVLILTVLRHSPAQVLLAATLAASGVVACGVWYAWKMSSRSPHPVTSSVTELEGTEVWR